MNKATVTVLAALITASSAFSGTTECKNQMDAFNRYQTINSGLLNRTLSGQIDHQTTDDIGQQNKIAQQHIDKGEFQEACAVYDAVIEKYAFKSLEEQYYEKHPEKRPENQEKPKTEVATSVSSSAEASAEASAVAGPIAESTDDDK